MVGAPDKLGCIGTRDVLEEHDLPRAFLHKEIQVAVVVDVDELWSRKVQPAEGGVCVAVARFVQDFKRIHDPNELRWEGWAWRDVRTILGAA